MADVCNSIHSFYGIKCPQTVNSQIMRLHVIILLVRLGLQILSTALNITTRTPPSSVVMEDYLGSMKQCGVGFTTRMFSVIIHNT